MAINGLTTSTGRTSATVATLPRVARVIVCAGALGDQGSTGHAFTRGQPDAVERERLAATLGSLLRSMRVERALSTRQLSARSTVTRSTITRLEGGERRPRPGLLAALAFGLDHEQPEPLAVAMCQAAGPSLRPDTAQAERRRHRRMAKAHREVRALRIVVGREAGRARTTAQRLLVDELAAIDVPPLRATYTEAQARQERAVLDRMGAILDARRRLDLRADYLMAVLAHPYHPLWKEPLERALER